MRAVYVAITRAKRNLYVFSNGNHFDRIDVQNITRVTDKNKYPAPSLICLQLSHEDVFLSYSANYKKEIDSLMSGQKLSIRDTGCFFDSRQIIKFSAKFCKKMNILKTKGYFPIKAYIRHIVFWKNKDIDDEIKIVLPNVEFSKSAKFTG